MLQVLYNTLYLTSHSLISATANSEDIGLTIDESFGHILIRLLKDSENTVETHETSLIFTKASDKLIQVLYHESPSDHETQNVIVIQEDQYHDSNI